MNLRESLLEHVRAPGYRPVNEAALCRALGIHKTMRRRLSHELRMLLSSGELVAVEGDRIALPGKGGLLSGRIQFRAGGSAVFIPDPVPGEKPGNAVQIAADDTGVALHGDHVEVKVRPPDPHGKRKGKFADEPTGKVTRVLSRARNTVVGHLQKMRHTFYVTPDDPRIVHDIVVPDPAKSRLDPVPSPGDKVVVKLSEWVQRHKLIEGEIIERLGKTFEPGAELQGVLRKFNLEPGFPAEVTREVASLPNEVRPAQLSGRQDYREIFTFTIDPDDAKDFDDALSIESLPGGDTRVGVHIADVSAYVRPGTALDREAHKRGNSTYLVGTVIPMLPEKLSNGLCSLVEAQDRLTKAVFLTFDRKGRLKQTDFADTVIRSRKRLTYRQAYALLFTDDLEKIRALPLPPKHQTGSTGRALSSLSNDELVALQEAVRTLWKLASKLRSDRMKNGSLDLDMPETKVFVDEKGYADRLEKIQHDESHQLIEEFMLAANEAVARLTRTKRIPSIYRVHDDPEDDRLLELRDTLGAAGVQVGDLTIRSEVVHLLEILRDHPQGYVLRTQLLRSLKKAAYRSTPDGHYGLNKRDYTHFTSPIRRYADLIVHRVFTHYLIQSGELPEPANYAFGYTVGRMEGMAHHISLTEINSQEAERESVKIKLLEFFERELKKDTPTQFRAVITDVRPNGFFVELVESMTFGFVPANTLNDDYYFINNAGDALVGRKRKRAYTLSSEVMVCVGKVDRFKRIIDFRPAPNE